MWQLGGCIHNRLDGKEEVDMKNKAPVDFINLVVKAGCTPSEAVDYWMIEIEGLDKKHWAGARGVGTEAIRKNIRQAKCVLNND